MASRKFPLVRGRKMRVTRLDSCGRPVYGDCNQVVTEGFISVALTARLNEGETISVQNAAGKTCISDVPATEFEGYGAELVFCDVDPDLFAMMSGQETVLDADGIAVGFRMSDAVVSDDFGYAIEVWAGVPGQACSTDPNAEGSFGYVLLPFVQGGVLGDFTIENAAINFTLTGANTKAGAGWGVGPHDVVNDGAGESPLLTPIGANDHLHVQYTEIAPPEATDGCVPVMDPSHTALTSIAVTDDALDATVVLTPSTPLVTAQAVLVDWGDGTWTYVDETIELTHTYAAAGTYTVSATRGGVTRTNTVTVAP